MIICVPIKRVIDYRVSAHIRPDADAIVTAGVKHSINPFDEIALERALQERDSGLVKKVIVVAVGDADTNEILRSALAMGADEAHRIHASKTPSPFLTAQLLKLWLEKNPCDCIITGKQAIDDDANQLGQLLAGFLGWSQAMFASKVSFKKEAAVEVTREIDGGLETIVCQMPAVISADLRLAEPRLASLPAIMLAKGKPITVTDASELELSLTEKTRVFNYRTAPIRQGGKRVANLNELMQVLNEAGMEA